MDEKVIRNEIEQGVAQVDDTLVVTDFACVQDKEKRSLKVGFTAKSPNNETVEVKLTW